MPLGSSSDAPVIRPGPRSLKNCVARTRRRDLGVPTGCAIDWCMAHATAFLVPELQKKAALSKKKRLSSSLDFRGLNVMRCVRDQGAVTLIVNASTYLNTT